MLQQSKLKETEAFQDKIIIIFGGLGFIGKNLVEHLAKTGIYKFKRIITVDKKIPVLSYCENELQDLFKNKEIIHYQTDLSLLQNVEEIFMKITSDQLKIDYVVNLAAETRFGCDKLHYKENIRNITRNLIQISEKYQVKNFIQVSTSDVYKSKLKPRVETSQIDPANKLARYHLKSENCLQKSKLNYVILRPCQVYGKYNLTGLTFRIMGNYVYKYLDETQILPWDKGHRISTVHVDDVCQAVIFCLQKMETNEIKQGQIFNLADNFYATSGEISQILDKIIPCQYEFAGNIATFFILGVKLNKFLKNFNEKHLVTWIEMCNKMNINSPLSLVLFKQNIKSYESYIDGRKICSLGFQYKYKVLSEESVLENINWMIKSQWIPPINSLFKINKDKSKSVDIRKFQDQDLEENQNFEKEKLQLQQELQKYQQTYQEEENQKQNQKILSKNNKKDQKKQYQESQQQQQPEQQQEQQQQFHKDQNEIQLQTNFQQEKIQQQQQVKLKQNKIITNKDNSPQVLEQNEAQQAQNQVEGQGHNQEVVNNEGQKENQKASNDDQGLINNNNLAQNQERNQQNQEEKPLQFINDNTNENNNIQNNEN